jgi:hypothetical protein
MSTLIDDTSHDEFWGAPGSVELMEWNKFELVRALTLDRVYFNLK